MSSSAILWSLGLGLGSFVLWVGWSAAVWAVGRALARSERSVLESRVKELERKLAASLAARTRQAKAAEVVVAEKERALDAASAATPRAGIDRLLHDDPDADTPTRAAKRPDPRDQGPVS